MNEDEYIATLRQQRHMYEWCLRNIGNLSIEDAKKEAIEFYKYGPPTEKYRDLVFHDDAWHWAMIKMKGEHYWTTDPGLEESSPEYQREWELYEKSKTKT